MFILDFLQHTKARTPAYMPRNRHHSSLRLCCLAEIVFKEVRNTPSFPKSREIKQKEWGKKKKQINKGKERKNSTLKAKKKHVLQGCNGCPTRLVGSKADRRFQASEWQPPRSRPSEETRQPLHDLSTDRQATKESGKFLKLRL
jgi:hypothetical protein